MPDSSNKPIALWLKEHFTFLWYCLLILSLIPAIQLVWAFENNALGVNPLQKLQQTTGFWALTFLCITLSITPLRRFITRLSSKMHLLYGKRLSDWNWIIRTRRMLGLVCFFYAVSHAGIYLHFDLGYDLQWAIEDFQQKPYLVFGLAALLLMIPLALTSPKFIIKKMGKYWRRLHRLMYPIAIIGLIHLWMSIKEGFDTHLYFTGIIVFLLAYRFLAFSGVLIAKARDDGMEVKARGPYKGPKQTNQSP